MHKLLVIFLAFSFLHAAHASKYIEVYGHRGDRSYSPENTIPGYRTALNVGVNWVDTDVVITKDRKILASHDLLLNPNLLQLNGQFIQKQEPVFNLTASELQKYDAGKLKPNTSYASYFPNQVPVDGTKMPLLEEVIQYVNLNSKNNVNFQIEIKTDPKHDDYSVPPEEFAKILYKILKEHHIVNRVEVQSFDWRYLRALQALDKHIKTAYLVEAYRDGILQEIKSSGGCCYEPEDETLTKEQLEEAHKLGLKVVVWGWPEKLGTAFSPELMNKLIDWGVDGIITDDPGRLNSMLAAKQYLVPKNYPTP